MHSDATEQFGHPDLACPELLPSSPTQRRFSAQQTLVFWAVLGINPFVYNFLVALEDGYWAFLRLLVALSGVAAVGTFLTWSTSRYGIGVAVIDRAPFGVRGAPLLAAVRVGFVGTYFGVWLLRDGEWLMRLAASAAGKNSLGWHPPGFGGTSAMAVVAASLFFIMAFMLVNGSIERIRQRQRMFLWLTVGLGLLLVAIAVYRAQSIPEGLLQAAPMWSTHRLLDSMFMMLAWCAPALLASQEWTRWTKLPEGGARLFRAGPWMVLPMGFFVAIVGLVMAHASARGRDALSSHPVADAAGFGGLGVGAAAAVWMLLLLLCVVPTVALHANASAILGWSSRRTMRRWGTLMVTLCCIALLPVAAALRQHEAPLHAWWVLALPLLAVHVAEELVRRRGTVFLEELYVYGVHYGPVLGFSVSGATAVAFGWALHPWLAEWWLTLMPAGVSLAKGVSFVHGAIAMGLGAAGLYLFLRPIEQRLATGIQARVQERSVARKTSKKQRERPVFSMHENSATAEATNPRFVAPRSRKALLAEEPTSEEAAKLVE